MLKIFGAAGSGSVPIEATLTLLGIPHEVVEVAAPGGPIRLRIERIRAAAEADGAPLR